jgi:phage recombination protein Bet
MSHETAIAKEATGLVTRQKILDYLRAFGLANQLNDQEAEQFINIAQEFQLNPFKREVHCVPYGEGANRKLSIIVGYETYIKRAERTGKLDGWRAWTEGQGEQLKAVVEIHRKDWQTPFRHEVAWNEAVQRKRDGSLTPFWQQKPHTMLKKVGISQAFRMAFPDELGGLPYDPSELGISQEQIQAGPNPVQATMASSAAPAPVENSTVPTHEALPMATSQAPSPEDPFEQLERFLDEQEERFTPSHLEWIRNQVEFTHTPEKAGQMLKYARRIAAEAAQADDPDNLRRLKQFTTSPIYRRNQA